MDQSQHTLIGVFVTWLPLLLLLGVWLFFIRKAKAQQAYVKTLNDRIIALNEELADLNRKMLVELQEIKAALKNRTP